MRIVMVLLLLGSAPSFAAGQAEASGSRSDSATIEQNILGSLLSGIAVSSEIRQRVSTEIARTRQLQQLQRPVRSNRQYSTIVALQATRDSVIRSWLSSKDRARFDRNADGMVWRSSVWKVEKDPQ